jgi:hypothetical protein
MTDFYKIVRFISVILLLTFVAVGTAIGQCTITNLNTSYCVTDAAVTLAPGSLTYYRTGSA